MADDDNEKPSTFEEEFWESLGTQGKPLDVEQIRQFSIERPISLDDVEHLMSLFPYLDLCNADVKEPPLDSHPVKVHRAQSLWLIHDRGDRLTTGPGRLNFGAYRRMRFDEDGNPILDDDDDEGGSQWVRPDGTIIKQFFDTAIELIEIAAERWPAANILSGYLPMQRAAWMAATEFGFAINYNPTAEDLMVFESIKQHGGGISRKRGGSSQGPTPSQSG